MKKNIIGLNEKSKLRSFGFCITLTLAVIQLFNFPAHAASFDCNKASTKLEHFICEDEELNEIDGILGTIYYDIRKQLGETDKEALKKDQISWIKERNKCNTNKNCLIQSYNMRIDYLESTYRYSSQQYSSNIMGNSVNQNNINSGESYLTEKKIDNRENISFQNNTRYDNENFPSYIVKNINNIQSIWNDTIPLLDKLLVAFDAQIKLPEKKIFGEDKISNMKKMNELKESILTILLESEVNHIWKDIQKFEQRIKSDKEEIASLREKRITAPETSYAPWNPDKKGIDKSIVELKDRIAESEQIIENIKNTLINKLHDIGIALGRDQFEALLSTVTSDDIINIIALSENLKAVVFQLVNLLEETGEDLAIARRYYGLYTMLLEVYVYCHESFLQKLDNYYLPNVYDIRREAEDTVKSAKNLLNNLNKDKAILNANIEANILTIKAADLYNRILLEQKEGITKDKSILERNLKVAQNTYQTVKISSRMVGLIRTGLQEFELLGNMELPDLRIFANIEMKKEFERLTGKLRNSK